MQITLDGHDRPIPATAGDTLLVSLWRAGVPFPFSCQTGSCGTCKCELVSGEVAELEHSEQALAPAERAKGLILACRSTPRGDVALRLVDTEALEFAFSVSSRTAMGYTIPLPRPPALPVAGSKDLFPVRRIFCVGRNYAEHQKEMGGDGREQPFFFLKSEHALMPQGGEVHYPAKSSNYHYETELVVALSKGGRRIEAKRANDLIFGYAVGLDMTRRDLQQWGKDHGRPWDFGKNFDESAPCGELAPAAKIGHPSKGAIWLNVNGKQRQKADLSDMIWSVPEQIAYLSEHYTLEPGDVIFTGTPAGVGPVKAGDELVAGIDSVGELKVKIVPAL